MLRSIVLFPLSLLYGAAAALRNFFYDQGILPSYKSGLRVISVGNISAGGNGKTPTVLYLAAAALRIGRRPVILSRGYKGTLRGPHIVRANDSYLEVGDEPLLMARRHNLTVVIAKDRVEGARFVERESLGDIIILDDGFQHRRLARDVDLVCVNWTDERSARDFRLGRILPWGLFREPKAAALRRASHIMFVNRGPGSSVPSLPEINRPVLDAAYGPTRVMNSEGEELKSGARAAAFSTIANPEGFRSTLERLGLKVEIFKTFADHYVLSAVDIANLKASGLPVVCTEKDWVKLPDVEAKEFFVVPVLLEPTDGSRVILDGFLRV